MIEPLTQSVRKMSSGFTIIEVLIYTGVMVIAVGAAVTSLISLNSVIMRNAVERDLAQAASASLEYLVREIRTADVVMPTLSTFGSSPGALTVVHGATTTRLYMNGGALTLEQNGAVLGPITTANVTVNSLIFTHFVGTNTELVRVALTLSTNSRYASSTRTYYTSAVLRGTYE